MDTQIKYKQQNKLKTEQTAHPTKYPQGHFKDKHCGICDVMYSPQAPSSKYCSDTCAHTALTSRYLERTYNIDYKKYIDMYDTQEGKCAICGGDGFTMAEHHKLKLVVDHCHATGKVRGLLCHNCNRGLGLFKDSKESLSAALNYLH